MERIEVNVITGEVTIIQFTQEKIDAIVAAQPTPSEQPIEPIAE
jgi:hypothetical protein